MNWPVSSIQPESSTAPACRNISQGERACRAPAASAAARVPSKAKEAAAGDIGHPFDHAGAGTVDQQHLAHQARSGARHQRRKRCDGRLLDPSVGMITLSMDEASPAQTVKTLHCYHLVTFKTAVEGFGGAVFCGS